MHSRPRAAQRACGLLSLLVLLSTAALVSPRIARADDDESASPTVDYAAPTPTAPNPNGVQQGHGPGGVTIGGDELDTQGTVVADGTAALPTTIDAHGFVVTDATTGEILAARDPHGRYYPASTLKTLTLLALYPELDPASVLTATFEDASVEGSRVGIVENGQYTVAQLWVALMLQSGNDVASMLTTAAGGLAQATKLMNDKATSLQAFDTLAATTSGLDVAGQSSSPYDLAIFMREIIENPTLRTIVSTPAGQLPPVPPKYPTPMDFGNDNHLIGMYDGAIGAKNGFTDAARHTYVAAAERGGRTVIVSLMQAEMTPTPSYLQAQQLLDWAFATPAGTAGVGTLVRPSDPLPAAATASTEASNELAATATATSSSSHSGGRDSGISNRWGLLIILGGLLAVAIWVAAPRSSRRTRRR